MQNTLSLPLPAAAQPCSSSVENWQKLLTYLLAHHYGLALSDTPFADETVIQAHVDKSLSLMDAINFIVARYGLVRIDPCDANGETQGPFLSPADILRARRATGSGRVNFPAP